MDLHFPPDTHILRTRTQSLILRLKISLMRRSDITTFFGYGTVLMTEDFASTTEMGKRMFFFPQWPDRFVTHLASYQIYGRRGSYSE
jgi:2-keto-3-deoxy-6-phosphogluconate aldolase